MNTFFVNFLTEKLWVQRQNILCLLAIKIRFQVSKEHKFILLQMWVMLTISTMLTILFLLFVLDREYLETFKTNQQALLSIEYSMNNIERS